MYRIDKKTWGYRITFRGEISPAEMTQWVEESIEILKASNDSFGVFVDMRSMLPLDQEAQNSMKAGQKLYQDSGMVRSVVILESALLTMQFKRIAKETGIYRWERYIDASSQAEWESIGLKWILNGTDPDH